jgi:hypothetical protein
MVLKWKKKFMKKMNLKFFNIFKFNLILFINFLEIKIK